MAVIENISATMPPKKKGEEEEKMVLIGRLATNLKCGIVGELSHWSVFIKVLHWSDATNLKCGIVGKLSHWSVFIEVPHWTVGYQSQVLDCRQAFSLVSFYSRHLIGRMQPILSARL